jgi:hypothetical protein
LNVIQGALIGIIKGAALWATSSVTAAMGFFFGFFGFLWLDFSNLGANCNMIGKRCV